MAEPAVRDVTFTEQLVRVDDKPASFHEGLDMGLEFSGARVAQLTLDLSECRTKLAKALTASEQRERLAQHWRAEAELWQGEAQRIGAEYSAFVREMARRFAR